MREAVGAIRGDLLKWARNERGLSLRKLSAQIGVAFSYLSELENGKKTAVRTDRLVLLVEALGVTDAFARGRMPRYLNDPAACRGLAGACINRVSSELESDTWTRLSVSARLGRVLSLVAEHSASLPRLVLAYVLGISLESLEGYIQGAFQAPPRHLLTAVSDLIGLPETVFMGGRTQSLEPERILNELLPAIEMAVRAKVPTGELKALIYQIACNHALRLQEGSALDEDLKTFQQN
jgi:transcriptional regulator with XRE-family HTH domain